MRALLPGDAGEEAPGLASPLQLRRLDVQLYDTARAVQVRTNDSDPQSVCLLECSHCTSI